MGTRWVRGSATQKKQQEHQGDEVKERVLMGKFTVMFQKILKLQKQFQQQLANHSISILELTGQTTAYKNADELEITKKCN
jgi:hypothetical protein